MIEVSDLLWFRLLAGLMVGLALGSFVTMLTYRVPRRLSILTPPSHCPQCKAGLGIFDLIPVGSWLFHNGKCSHCGGSISVRYPLIELLTAGLTMLAFAFTGFHPSLLLALIMIVAGVSLLTFSLEGRSK